MDMECLPIRVIQELLCMESDALNEIMGFGKDGTSLKISGISVKLVPVKLK